MDNNMPRIDDTLARFCKLAKLNKAERYQVVKHTPIYWKSQIGFTATLPRAINYYLQWCQGSQSADKRYHDEQLAIVTAYFQQWLGADCWLTSDNTALDSLRTTAASVCTVAELNALRQQLTAAGIDPI